MSDTQYWKRVLPSDFRLVIPLGVRAMLLGDTPLDLISGEEVLFSEGAQSFPSGGYTDALAKWDKPEAHVQFYRRGETFAILLTNKPVWVEPEHKVPDRPVSGCSFEGCWVESSRGDSLIHSCSIKDCSMVAAADEEFWDAFSKLPYVSRRRHWVCVDATDSNAVWQPDKTLLQNIDFEEMELRILASLGLPDKWLADFMRPTLKKADTIDAVLSLGQPKDSLEKLEIKCLKRREPAPATGVVFKWPPVFSDPGAEWAAPSNAEQVVGRARTDSGRMCNTRPTPFHRLPPLKSDATVTPVSELYKAPRQNLDSLTSRPERRMLPQVQQDMTGTTTPGGIRLVGSEGVAGAIRRGWRSS